MPRENEYYRPIVDELEEMFPGKHVLNYNDIAKYTGRSVRFVKEHWSEYYNKSVGGIQRTKYAQIASK